MESIANILDETRVPRGRATLHLLLRDLADSLGGALGSRVTITDWTVDPAAPDNGVDIRVEPSHAVGSAAAGVLAFLHHPGEGAWVTAFLLSFDAHGTRIAAHAGEVLILRLTPDGWVSDGWQPDGNYEWEAYADDVRWRGAAKPPPSSPPNQHAETVARLSRQVERLRAGLAGGERPSDLVRELHAQGLSMMELLVVAREATGASLADLKGFGTWWSPAGITDDHAFDEWAAAVLR